MPVTEMTDEHLESYKKYCEDIRKGAKAKLDEIYAEQMRRAAERATGTQKED